MESEDSGAGHPERDGADGGPHNLANATAEELINIIQGGEDDPISVLKRALEGDGGDADAHYGADSSDGKRHEPDRSSEVPHAEQTDKDQPNYEATRPQAEIQRVEEHEQHGIESQGPQQSEQHQEKQQEQQEQQEQGGPEHEHQEQQQQQQDHEQEERHAQQQQHQQQEFQTLGEQDQHPFETSGVPVAVNTDQQTHDEQQALLRELEGDEGTPFADNELQELTRHLEQTIHDSQRAHVEVEQSYPVDKELADLRRRTVPTLDNVATQLLDVLSDHSHQETLTIVTQPDTPAGRAYSLLTELYRQTKKIFVESSEFLVASEIGLVPETREEAAALQRSNLATFVSALFGSLEVGFYHLNKYFLHTFGGKNERLLKSQINLFLDLKTQAYISAMSQDEGNQKEILDDLFPEDPAELLDWKRTMPGRDLTRVEIDMVKRARRRREILASEPPDGLTAKYPWTAFLRDVCDYVGRNHATLVQREPAANGPKRAVIDAPGSQTSVSISTANGAPTAEPARVGRKKKTPGVSEVPVDTHTPAVELYEATRRGHEARRDRPGDDREKRPRAFTRKPWSQEEERTLLEAMEEVGGTHWAKILELHGPGGSQSEVLKDRNQVQLKDKARNLKMFFVRNNAPMPRVLNMVTGEYETRTRGARKNASTAGGQSAGSRPSSVAAAGTREASPDVTAASTPASTVSHPVDTQDAHAAPQPPHARDDNPHEPNLDELIQTVGQYIKEGVGQQAN